MMKLKSAVLTVMAFLCLNFPALCKTEPGDFMLMPYPAKVVVQQGKFRLNKDFAIAVEGIAHNRLYTGTTRFLRRLDGRTGLFFAQEFTKPESSVDKPGLLIKTEREGKVELFEDEAYQLSVTPDKITLSAKNDIGALRGLETLLQLLEADEQGYFFPAVNIEDSPRFPWRGLMIDVARHFHPIEVIKRNIDGMAAVKMNVLHLHLSDDQGFRVESKVYPQLHELASEGQYFTQEEIREIIRYANERAIRVVPEFDVPGHATSFLVAFPDLASAPGPYTLQNNAGIFDPTLNPTIEKTYEVLENLFEEMAALFPDTYFHIGGDENEGKHWDANSEIQAFMKKNKIADNHQLQTYFNKRILEFLTRYNKKMMGWDEILQPDLPKSSLIQSWRGTEGLFEAARNGYATILSNGYYIDLMHPAADHYLIDPLPANNNLTEQQKRNILGGEATMWSELVTPHTIDSRIWPRTAAIAERFWSPAETRDVEDMYRRLDYVSFRLEELGLTHIRNRQVILRNLANGRPIEPLQTLVEVVEPMKGYTRNPGGTMYTMYSPYTLFADAAAADAKAAREFNGLVNNYIVNKNKEDEEKLVYWLERWKGNHAEVQKLIVESPVLKEIEKLSENLSSIAELGLASLNKEFNGDGFARLTWYNQSMQQLRAAREQGGRTELQVVNAIEKLIKVKAGAVGAYYTARPISVDGEFNEWEGALWDYFVPTLHKKWKDTCHYALLWDETNLYIALKVDNKQLQASKKKRDATGLHFDDGVEFLIDSKLDRATEWQDDDLAYHINVLNAQLDDRGLNKKGEYNNNWNGKAKSAVKVLGTINKHDDDDQGYHVEIAISWKEIGKVPENGALVGINLCVNDRDDKTQEYRYFDLMNLPVFHYPAGFAELVLIKQDLNP